MARKRDRQATQRALMETALELMERDGVLAGLNMREVADTAGVNRGLIHQYFGSRAALLRAGIEMGLQEAETEALARRVLPTGERIHLEFEEVINNPRYIKLLTLLALDGEDYEPIAFLAQRFTHLEEEQQGGAIAEDVDLEALIMAWDALLIGYALLRAPAAKQLGTTTADLDARVEALARRFAASTNGPALTRRRRNRDN